MSELKKTPLHDLHIEDKAKMVDFAGYHMPLNYSNIKAEYGAVREDCGIFDVSHMQVLKFTAPQSGLCQEFLNIVCLRNTSRLKAQKVQYNAILTEQGGILDDITIYKIDEYSFYMISNASRASFVYNHIIAARDNTPGEILSEYSKGNSTLPDFKQIKIETFKNHCLIAVQGPNSEKIVQTVLKDSGLQNSIKDVNYYHFFVTENPQENQGVIFMARTGYTGEDGFEIFCPADSGIALWNSLKNAGATLCGLASRDLLRMEVFYPLYGNELSEQTLPYEVSMEKFVDTGKAFIGRQALLKSNSENVKTLRGIIMEDAGAIPRHGFKVFNETGEEIGECTSGGFSFKLDRGIGIVSIKTGYAGENQTVWLDIRSQKKAGKIAVKSPIAGSIKRKNG